MYSQISDAMICWSQRTVSITVRKAFMRAAPSRVYQLVESWPARPARTKAGGCPPISSDRLTRHAGVKLAADRHGGAPAIYRARQILEPDFNFSAKISGERSMPKSSGQSLKILRGPSRPQPTPRPVKLYRPAPGPHHNPPPATPPTPSNEVAAHAVRVASSPGGIDGKQQHY
jgi:hypothetical protein